MVVVLLLTIITATDATDTVTAIVTATAVIAAVAATVAVAAAVVSAVAIFSGHWRNRGVGCATNQVTVGEVVLEGCWKAKGMDTSCVGAVKHHRCTLVASETDFWLFCGITMSQTFFRTCVEISFCNFLSQKSL